MIWIDEGLRPTPPVDVVIFDVDGILIDDTVSYYAAVKATVSHVVSTLHRRPAADSFVTDRDIAAYKAAGGFNDDWVLAYTLCGLILAAPPGAPPPLADIAQQSAGRGMPWIRQQYFANLELDLQIVDTIGREHYWGADLLQERLGRAPTYHHGAGFVRLEQPLIPPDFLAQLSRAGVERFGIITGRDDIELRMAFETLGLAAAHPFDFILDSRFIRKPDARALLAATEALRPTRALYIGDTGDDLQLVLNYRESPRATAPCLAAVVPKPGQWTHFEQAGADMLLERTAELPAALQRLRVGDESK